MHVFISYAHEGSDLVNDLSRELSASGLETFLDVRDIAWGERITDDVQRALDMAAGVIVVVSPASMKSQWVPYEVGYATALRKPLLPFLTHPSITLPGYLADWRYLSDLKDIGQFVTQVRSIGQTGVVSNGDQLSEAARAARMIAEIQPQMPEFLAEMRDDLRSDESGLVREFVVMPNERATFSDPKP